MHLPQRTHLVNRWDIRGLLSSLAVLLDFFLQRSGLTPMYWYMDWSSHLPYLGQPVQSAGWVARISSMAIFLTFSASGPLTLILMPSFAMVSHAGAAPLPPSISTEHRRQPPLASRSGWLQRWGMKTLAAKAASSTDWPSFASISFPSIVIFIFSLLFQDRIQRPGPSISWYQYSNPSSSAAAFSPAMRPLFRQKPMVLPARING